MAVAPVIGYRMGWNPKTNKGGVTLRLPGGQEENITADSAEELAALAAILNESPVGYDPANGNLVTGWEQVGGT